MPMRTSAPDREALARRRRTATWRRPRRRPSLVIVGQGALRGEDGAAVLGAAMALADAHRVEAAGAAHRGRRGSGAMDLGCVTEGGIAAALDGAEVVYNLGADEIEIAGRAVRDLSGQPRRPRRAPGRRDPAGRGLDRGERASSSIPRAGRRWPTARAFRRARRGRTGRSCGRCRRSSGATLPFDSLAALRAAHGRGGAAPRADRRGAGKRVDAGAEAGDYGAAEISRAAVREHYLSQSGRAGEPGDGGAGAAGQRRAARPMAAE